MKQRLGGTAYETWIEPLKLQIENEHSVILKAPDQFFCDWVTKHYSGAIEELAPKHTEKTLVITIKADASNSSQTHQNLKSKQDDKTRQAHYALPNLNARYTFDNFVVGPSNRHAHLFSRSCRFSGKSLQPAFYIRRGRIGKNSPYPGYMPQDPQQSHCADKNTLCPFRKIYKRAY